uniref:Tenascin-like isoform X2 n=1 Tax=Petromyzon marinus TaxID=7757 RepID=A0AAJ7WZM4_PETMA|nr:tenascin-like isoform X2 [Petromyzon marinus]
MGGKDGVAMAVVVATTVTMVAVLAQLLPTAAGGTLEVLTERLRRDVDSSVETSLELGNDDDDNNNNNGGGGGTSSSSSGGGGSQPVHAGGGRHPHVYNHVYTINMPPSALCGAAPQDGDAAADGDSAGAGSAPIDAGGAAGSAMFMEQTEDSDSQIVFTHRISIPRKACGCRGDHAVDHDGDSPLLRQLLSRIELLEHQVSALRQQCTANGNSNGYGCCGGGAGGAGASAAAAGNVDYLPPCSGHGNFSLETCGCSCDDGWGGANCSEPLCLPASCGDRGRCVDGECLCPDGHEGDACRLAGARCPDDCGDQGRCVDGECRCFEGFEGDACQNSACPDGCNDQGRCVGGECRCYEGFSGERCDVADGREEPEEPEEEEREKRKKDEEKEEEEEEVVVRETDRQILGSVLCTRNCSGLGACVGGACVCNEGILGEDCSEVPPPRNVTVTGVTDRTVDLAWAHDLVVTEYVLRYSPVAPGGLVLEVRATGDSSNATLRELEPGVEYLVTVQAVLNGLLSVPVSARVHTHLSKPEGLRFKSIDETEVEVVWEPFSVALDGWQITFHHGAADVVTDLHGGATSHLQSGLLPGEEYEVRLVAVLDGAHGPPAVATLATPLDAPRNLRASHQGESGGGLLLEWENSRAQVDGYRVVFAPIAGGPHGSVNVTHQGPDLTSAVTITDLMPGTEYGVGVTAYRGDIQSKPSTINTRTEMDSPLNLHVMNAWDTGLTVRWDPCRARVDRYAIMHISGTGAIGELAVPGSETSANLTGLRPATEYTVVLQAESGLEKSRPATLSANTGFRPVQTLHFSDVSSSGFRVAWEPPAVPVDAFVLRVSEAARGPGEGPGEGPRVVTIDGGQSDALVSGLLPERRYDVSLVAVKGMSTGEAVLGDVATVSDALQGTLQAYDVTSDSLKITWPAQEPRPDNYHIKYRPIGRTAGAAGGGAGGRGGGRGPSKDIPGKSWSLLAPASATRAKLTGLQPGTRYEIALHGVRGSQLTKPLEVVARTSALNPPMKLSFSNVTQTSVTVRWAAREPTPSSYQLSYELAGGDGDREMVSLAGGVTEYTLQDLTPGTEYTVGLAYLPDPDNNDASTGSVTTVLDSPVALLAVNVEASEALLVWRPGRAPIDSYIVTYSTSGHPGGEEEVETLNVPAPALEQQLTGLRPASTYHATVRTVKGALESPPRATTFTTASGSPLAVTFGFVTESTVEVKWLSPTPAPDWFIVSYVPTNGGEVESVTVAGALVSHTLTGLSPGTEYEVSVASLSGAVESEPISSSVTTAIDAPRDLAAVEVAGQSALLTWRPSLANITGYTLRVQGPDGDTTELQVDAGASSRHLDGLTRSTPYSASLYALRGDERSAAALADFTTDGRLIQNPQDCAEQSLNGETESRVYTVYVRNNESQPLLVFCDMSTDGGGWIVFQRRQNGHTEFFRDWKSYARGFGDLRDEFWLGLDNLHRLTQQGRYELRVDLHDGPEEAFALYDRFAVADAAALYRLRIGAYNGTAGDSLSYHQGRPFSAPDRDNDVAVTNCAISYKGAWWYKNCHRVNLNGKYGEASHSQGINWYHWKGHEHSIPFVEMKMRPHGYVHPPGEQR